MWELESLIIRKREVSKVRESPKVRGTRRFEKFVNRGDTEVQGFESGSEPRNSKNSKKTLELDDPTILKIREDPRNRERKMEWACRNWREARTRGLASGRIRGTGSCMRHARIRHVVKPSLRYRSLARLVDPGTPSGIYERYVTPPGYISAICGSPSRGVL